MNDCTRFEEMEDLVLGVVPPHRRAEVEAHRATCDSCRAAHAMFAQERSLFVARAAAVVVPPAALPAARPAPPRFARSLRTRALQAFRRGHASVAAAAALFVVAAFSRLPASLHAPPAIDETCEPSLVSTPKGTTVDSATARSESASRRDDEAAPAMSHASAPSLASRVRPAAVACALPKPTTAHAAPERVASRSDDLACGTSPETPTTCDASETSLASRQ